MPASHQAEGWYLIYTKNGRGEESLNTEEINNPIKRIYRTETILAKRNAHC